MQGPHNAKFSENHSVPRWCWWGALTSKICDLVAVSMSKRLVCLSCLSCPSEAFRLQLYSPSEISSFRSGALSQLGLKLTAAYTSGDVKMLGIFLKDSSCPGQRLSRILRGCQNSLHLLWELRPSLGPKPSPRPSPTTLNLKLLVLLWWYLELN